jgi:hypothetical protein
MRLKQGVAKHSVNIKIYMLLESKNNAIPSNGESTIIGSPVSIQ